MNGTTLSGGAERRERSSTAAQQQQQQLSWTNPVWDGSMADPFVLRCDGNGGYYAYGTGAADGDGRQFPTLYSADLCRWEYVGGALTPPAEAPRDANFWAPAAAERDGVFYLYYSFAARGDDTAHRLRVAIADAPTGPFQDTGRLLLPAEGFTIDAHPFYDRRSDRWYLFYARDYLDGDRVGTGLAAAPLGSDMISVCGPSVTVLRATADWQIYEQNRDMYGRRWSAWHTLEGPCVIEHEGRYFCFYSGGCWQNPGYGVSYAVADHPLGPWQEVPLVAEDVLPDKRTGGRVPLPAILRTSETDGVHGPGHNSVVVGPDGVTEFLVYHAWDADRTARRMHLDRLLWTANGPRCDGPAAGPRHVPLAGR